MPSVLSPPRSRRVPWYERFALLCIVALSLFLWLVIGAVVALLFLYL